jgi:LmbE family N-acetylglucosaminyl deacetylase
MRNSILVIIAALTISFVPPSLPKDKKIIMAVFAHPDDEIDVMPLLSLYARKGNDVYLVIATNGEKGVAEHAMIPAGDTLARVRKGEAYCACQTMDIHDPILLGMNDGSLDEDFTGQPLHQKLDSIFRLYQPDVVITWGPEGGYGHMDHRLVHDVVTEIFQSGQLVKPKALYYSGIPMENFKELPDFQGKMTKLLKIIWKPVKKEYLTTRIKFDKVDIDRSIRAMYCHKSQFSPLEMIDIKYWMEKMNRDTVYLRPFLPSTKIQFGLFE